MTSALTTDLSVEEVMAELIAGVRQPTPVSEVFDTPGFYEVSSTTMIRVGAYFRIEVAEDLGVHALTVHQLTAHWVRDGVLLEDWWSPDALVLRKVEKPSLH